MSWVVLPCASLLVEVLFVEIVLVVVVYVIVVDVDVDIAVAPSGVPTPAPAPSGSQGDPGPECNRRSRRIISRGRVVNRGIRIDRRTINDSRVV